METPDWNHLQDFLAVARTGRLTAGARHMGVDHTTLSRRIAALETALMARLFDRSPQGYALTAHGERLVVVAEVDPALVRPGDDPDNGQIVLTSCPASAITAWFADEPGTDVADAAAISKGLTIDQAWDLPQVQALLQEHDLLWNDVVEYRRG